jgi:hypothetical protein
MAIQQADEPFRLSALPDKLWGMARMIDALRADDQTIRRWVREGCLPGPCLRRNGRPYWDPADVESFRRKRLHRIGAETGEAVGLGDSDGLR